MQGSTLRATASITIINPEVTDSMIYLDYAASTPTLPEVVEAMTPWFLEYYGNPSATHIMGQKAAEAIDDVKETIADKIGCYPSEIIFTSGATEANNLAIKGFALANKHKGNHIVTSVIEHKCVLNICAYLEKQGFDVTYVMPNKDGTITAEAVAAAITDQTILVSVMHVNNELGTINPIEAIGEICYEKRILFHSDTAQSFCKLDIDVLDMNLDAISVSAHKFGGPKGIGFTYIRDARNCHIEPVIHGASQQHGLRGGTLPTPLIVGLGKAIQCFRYDRKKLRKIRDEFLVSLKNKGISFTMNGKYTIENIINITLHDSNLYAKVTSSKEFCLSKGSACNSSNIVPSHVMQYICQSNLDAHNTIRISFINYQPIFNLL